MNEINHQYHIPRRGLFKASLALGLAGLLDAASANLVRAQEPGTSEFLRLHRAGSGRLEDDTTQGQVSLIWHQEQFALVSINHITERLRSPIVGARARLAFGGLPDLSVDPYSFVSYPGEDAISIHILEGPNLPIIQDSVDQGRIGFLEADLSPLQAGDWVVLPRASTTAVAYGMVEGVDPETNAYIVSINQGVACQGASGGAVLRAGNEGLTKQLVGVVRQGSFAPRNLIPDPLSLSRGVCTKLITFQPFTPPQ